MRIAVSLVMAVSLAVVLCSCRERNRLDHVSEFAPGIAFTNDLFPKQPWSICVARISRENHDLTFRSTHANGGALGLTPLTAQIAALGTDTALPVVAINGDFYQRERDYAGDPRGLQIIDGEVISAPAGTAAVWFDADGKPAAANAKSAFALTWPDGKIVPFGLNEERKTNGIVLFTTAIGPSTKTSGGVELVLERDETNSCVALAVNKSYAARVREVRDRGDTPVKQGTMVLSLGPAVVAPSNLSTGALLRLSTTTIPELTNAVQAISGGPILIRNGKRLKIDPAGLFETNSYSARSMFDQHPRTAIGWNDRFLFLVQVDGRHRSSVGMTLEELGKYMERLGCTEAVNLDGGGSATFWVDGRIANRPCDGFERPIANGLVAMRKKAEPVRR